MRRILIDNARRKQTVKHGGTCQRYNLDELDMIDEVRSDDLLALDEALNRLEAEDAAKAELVKLRYFAGLSIEDAAAALKISTATANRHWAYARAWLFRAVEGGDQSVPC